MTLRPTALGVGVLHDTGAVVGGAGVVGGSVTTGASVVGGTVTAGDVVTGGPTVAVVRTVVPPRGAVVSAGTGSVTTGASVLGGAGGYLVPRGKGKPFVFGLLFLGAAVGVAALAFGLAALVGDQPYAV